MSDRHELSRRGLLKVVGGVGASFMLGSFATVACANPALMKDEKAGRPVFAPNAYVKVDPDGSVTVTITRSDMGQGVRTSLAMLVAEEMDLDWTKVKVIQAGAGVPPIGGGGTGGSSSIRSMHRQLRQMGASARAMLVGAAAKQWGVDASTLKTVHGTVVNPANGKSIPYADLTAAAAAEPLPTGVTLKDAKDFQIVGKGANRVDNTDVATGKAMYGADFRVEGMAFAVIARPPAFGATLKSVDDADARKVPGVIDVQKVDSGVAVFATNTWAAMKGREALKLEWNPGPNADLTTAKITEALKGAVVDHKPMPAGAKVVEATYDLPYLAHATMEPMNCLADVKGDHCTLYCSTQAPTGAQGSAARVLNIPKDNVTVHVALLGGGFGRRFQVDFVNDAVKLSKLANRPVQLVYSREDDMRNDFYRPASHHAMKGAVDGGKAVGWSHQAVQAEGGRANGFRGAGIPYEIADAGMMYGGVDFPIPTGAWRSVENSQLNVANECFIDELAHAAGKDPLEFRLAHAKDDRLKNVLEQAGKLSDWGKPLPAGHGRGIACFVGYGSCIAHVVEASVQGGKVKLHRVVAVVDPGLAVNPKGVEAQVQGGCVDGLSTALRAEITIDKGGVVQGSWPDYKWMTMDAMPKIECHIVSGSADPGGMGEVGYPSVPPAVANAVAAATGKRVRKFPIRLEELV
ncbi:xanthine dehydrogenase family protein molybdopterin-binding subunit [Fimbriimonas ginsengisoli]|uniref:Molybdopterin-binding xanthine dehydrogenase n=1 Tax=Fimbriimonas ginsengisoli Gsoil 348 TaxID=661478 RepID=A0A068NNG2_FIMGI|nr:molybdopterin cofactor-binding domain-containing protein [Fimbriimonas ginsengisoli]AIE84300.1 molybdopterin-binding xanthine dehydrogenase [Fimbriimonas ginsengisoli Gsoil 348]